MPRLARVVAVGLPHHITQRGNYQQDVFRNVADRIQYLAWIQEYSIKYGLSILAYCLMQNHVHFIAIPTQEDSLARTFNAAHMRYAQYFNKKLKQRGHLWQGRFYSCVLDEPHLILATRYIERNPVRAGIVDKPWQWLWSSASTHTGRERNKISALEDFFGLTGISQGSWEIYIDSVEEKGLLADIRKCTFAGRPLGEDKFIKKLEVILRRRLSAPQRGRPKKDEK